jgi:hypothetical protein
MPRCRRRIVLSSVVALAGLSLLVAACGSGDSRGPGVAGLGTTTASVAATTTDGSAPGGELADYARCMRSHGVLGFPDPASIASSSGIKAAKSQIAQVAERDTSSATFQSAQRACAKYYGHPPAPARPGAPEIQKLLAVSRCMRAHGIQSFPDPDPTTGALTPPAGIVRNSPRVIAALRACSSLGKAAGLGPPTTTP